MKKTCMIIAVFIALSVPALVWANPDQPPILGNVIFQKSSSASSQPKQNPKGKKVLGELLSHFDNSNQLKTDQVATSVVRYVLAQNIPTSTILILTPKTDNKVTEQFKGYLSAMFRFAGYSLNGDSTKLPTSNDKPKSSLVAFSVYPYQDGIIVTLAVNQTQMSRFYELDPSGAIKSASAYMIRQQEDSHEPQ
jgi:hypothetical protein